MRYLKHFMCAGMLAIPLSSMITSSPVFASPQVQVEVDGQMVFFPDVQPYIDARSGRTMVPVRFIAESFGAEVEWNGGQVTFKYQDQTIILSVGQDHAQVNGKKVGFDAPAVMMNHRTMVPLRFISELFGAQVEWVGVRQLVVVTMLGDVVGEQKGTWIWDARILKTEQEDILKFVADNRVTVLYLHIDKDVRPQIYKDFIRGASERGIQVEALAGRPQWAFRDHQVHIQEWITWVKKYNASADPKERFRGLHFDIEPYVLKEWITENQWVIEQWMDNMRFIVKETKDTGLKITMDLPFWMYKFNVPNADDTLSRWLLKTVDRVVIMDYRNFALGANGMVVHGVPILKEAAAVGKKVVIAVDTKPSKEGDHTTFYSKGVKVMEKELELARKEFAGYSSFAGFAIHDLRYWKALDQKGGIKQ